MISVLFQTETHFPVDRKKIRHAIIKALEGTIKRHAEVSVSIVGDRAMKQLNTHYRNIDATTDVLSFSLSDPTEKGVPFVDAPDHILRLGDIVVSFPQAVVEAIEANKLVDDVIVELSLHGLNHLLGLHHD